MAGQDFPPFKDEGQMHETRSITVDVEKPGALRLVSRIIQIFFDITVRPGRFFEQLSEKSGYGKALLFLVVVSCFFSLLSSLFVFKDRPLFALIFFLNAFTMPFVTAFVLYLVAMVMCKDTFTYQNLFAVTAYSNVTLLAAWVPGLAWMTGIWKFYLVGLGMARMGRISGMRAFLCILTCAGILIVLANFLQPVLKA